MALVLASIQQLAVVIVDASAIALQASRAFVDGVGSFCTFRSVPTFHHALGLVFLSSESRIVQPLTIMDQAGLSAMHTGIDAMVPSEPSSSSQPADLCTALEMALGMLKSAFQSLGYTAKYRIIVITSSLHSRPPHEAHLGDFLQHSILAYDFMPRIDVYGIGSHINGDSLHDLACTSRGFFGCLNSSVDNATFALINAAAEWNTQEPLVQLWGAAQLWRPKLVDVFRGAANIGQHNLSEAQNILGTAKSDMIKDGANPMMLADYAELELAVSTPQNFFTWGRWFLLSKSSSFFLSFSMAGSANMLFASKNFLLEIQRIERLWAVKAQLQLVQERLEERLESESFLPPPPRLLEA